MGSIQFDPQTIRQRLQELAFLNSSATITYTVLPEQNGSSGPSSPTTDVLHYEGGLKEYVTHLNSTRQRLHEPIFFSRTVCCIAWFKSAWHVGADGTALPGPLISKTALCRK